MNFIHSLSVIAVTGEDACQFLQGQLTCNLKDISLQKASIAGFCNAKGRMIATLLVVEFADGYYLVLPSSLVDIVIDKLKKYVLRAKVKLHKPEHLRLLGLCEVNLQTSPPLPIETFACSQTDTSIYIKMPAQPIRYLCIHSPEDAHHSALTLDQYAIDDATWRFQDLSSGLPWFEVAQSEQFIPQMLNLDLLGGISFNKGCYTGQEIIARTHYLGKAKRQLFLGECSTELTELANLNINNPASGTHCGEVLTYQACGHKTRFLLVLQIVEDIPKTLILNDSAQTPIHIIS